VHNESAPPGKAQHGLETVVQGSSWSQVAHPLSSAISGATGLPRLRKVRGHGCNAKEIILISIGRRYRISRSLLLCSFSPSHGL
jgi:hypothetical protein